MDNTPLGGEQGRLAWRCRRGMKELDLLLSNYLRLRWREAPTTEKAAFERILELPDPLLAAYLMQRETPPDPDLDSLLAVLRDQAGQRHAGAAATAAPSSPQRT